MSYQSPILLVGEAVACRRPGALVNKLESAWLEGIWLGRDSKTEEHLIGTLNGMVRSRALKRRVERRRWDTNLLNAMVLDLWNPTPVTRRPLKVRSDREPILVGPLPRVHFTPPDDPDTAVAPTQETAPGTTTTPINCRGKSTYTIRRSRSRRSTTGAKDENIISSSDDHN